MPKEEPEQCARMACRCLVPHDHEYCGESCRDAGHEKIGIACEWGKPNCPLT